jgi:hypothetical protein
VSVVAGPAGALTRYLLLRTDKGSALERKGDIEVILCNSRRRYIIFDVGHSKSPLGIVRMTVRSPARSLLVRRIMAKFICAPLLVALVACILSAEPSHARSLFWSGSWWGDHSFRHKQQHRRTKADSTKSAQPKESAKGPLQIIISIADQRISLYDNGALIARSSVSTGVASHPTPLGVFSVIGKEKWHRSNIYSAAPMPYMQRITWSGIALHAGDLPGYPASHGCIRLKNDFAIRLFHLTKRGTRVIVAHDDVRPVEISNPHLFPPKPKVASGSAEPGTASLAGPDKIAATASYGQLVSNDEKQAPAQVPLPASAGVPPPKVVPISVFVSRKLSKLFVRQGFTPLFDVPVNIQSPAEPIGTHVFSAMEIQNEGAAIRWTVVSIPEKSTPGVASQKLHKGAAKRTVETVSPAPDKASAAFDRIEIPREAVERISELLTPGSSLIISDHGISNETGKDTDFIVLTH